MRHNHDSSLVTDRDSYFKIDPNTRQLSNGNPKKLSLIKGDHNSERFTFELPLHVEGHDMSKCNKVEVHYINVDSKTRAKNEGVYIITDHEDAYKINPDNPDTVIAEWLISGNVTQYSGTLTFIIRYMCVGDDGIIAYAWNTAMYSGIGVLDSINNSDIVVEEYSDVLQEWYEKLLSAFDGNIDLNSKEAVKFWVGSHAEYAALEEIIEDCLYIITDDSTLKVIEGRVITLEKAVEELKTVDGGLDEALKEAEERLDEALKEAEERLQDQINGHTTSIGINQNNIIKLQENNKIVMSQLDAIYELLTTEQPDIELPEPELAETLEISFPFVKKTNAPGTKTPESEFYQYSATSNDVVYDLDSSFVKCSINDVWVGGDYTIVKSVTELRTTTYYEAKFEYNKLTIRTRVRMEVMSETATVTGVADSATAKFWI